MCDEAAVLDILIDVFFKKNKKVDVAKKYQKHRNTISDICKRYKAVAEPLKDNMQDKDEATIREKLGKAIAKSVPSNIVLTEAHKKEIKKYCLAYLNCYHFENDETLRLYVSALCEKYEISIFDIANRNANSVRESHSQNMFGEADEEALDDYLKKIHRVQRLKIGKKNYREVFQLISQTKLFQSQPVDENTFYQYVKKKGYWQNNRYMGMTFYEVVHENLAKWESEFFIASGYYFISKSSNGSIK